MNRIQTASVAGINREVQAHYGRPQVGEAIVTALEAAGMDLTRLTAADLAPIDEFHSGGRAATLELAQAAGLKPGLRVLDVGSGVGGTARCLAQEFGCRVTGVDVTDEYCHAARMLARQIGLDGLVDFRQGDATSLPFDDGFFDIVWTEHAAMNIPDKQSLYAEMYRVLRPGGILAIHDILAGPRTPLYFPVPWARTPLTSFLVTPDALRSLLESSGFQVTEWTDKTAAARTWFARIHEKVRLNGPPLLGPHLLVGPDFPEMVYNLWRNLDESRTVLAQVIARK